MIWLSRALVLAIHDEQLAEHGGAVGVCETAFDNALKPTVRAKEGLADLSEIAAVYALKILRNRPFVDGDLGTACVAMELFLSLNGADLRADNLELANRMLELRDDYISEEGFRDWLRARVVSRGARAVR